MVDKKSKLQFKRNNGNNYIDYTIEFCKSYTIIDREMITRFFFYYNPRKKEYIDGHQWVINDRTKIVHETAIEYN